MIKKLPYPGHTWSFTQHAVGLKPETLYNFLKCAAPFVGIESAEYKRNITNVMIKLGILTPNIRKNTPDAWRDYQQILAELGLIYSTKITQTLQITEIGYLYLAKEIGFSELIGIQALRYQYPNGQKSTIQKRLKEQLTESGLESPATLLELQTDQGILLKPGTLILRILLELGKLKESSHLTPDECQNFLLPCRKNSEWTESLHGILSLRKNTVNEPGKQYLFARRNIQDWFKFLSKSDFFEIDKNGILFLSKYAQANLAWAEACCKMQERIESFWIPTSFDIDSRRSWFSWFGSSEAGSQLVIRADVELDSSYVNENYISPSRTNESSHIASNQASDVALSALDLSTLERDPKFNFNGDLERIVANLEQGAETRHSKTVLHDKMIQQLAEKFIRQGAEVQADPNTIDLYASWPSGNSAIFEIKTVTPRNLSQRLRLAVGQIQEYSYRKDEGRETKSDQVIVINHIVPDDSWSIKFLTEYLQIGLICQTTNDYAAYSAESSLSRDYWLDK